MQLESANSRVVGRRQVMAEIPPGNYSSFAKNYRSKSVWTLFQRKP